MDTTGIVPVVCIFQCFYMWQLGFYYLRLELLNLTFFADIFLLLAWRVERLQYIVVLRESSAWNVLY